MAIGLENLKIYQLAADAEIKVYKITKSFPKDEKFRSVDQLRRSSSSVTNNIAEAYNKKSTKEKIHILNNLAKCEAQETKFNLMQCARKEFADAHQLTDLVDTYTDILKAISGYINFLKNQQTKKPTN
ncbi:four helix bundle protein [Candidatus Falkowbacteria bacterium]|nr:four helix bundle protein [Candidatus Falkowbacteria bacterium]